MTYIRVIAPHAEQPTSRKSPLLQQAMEDLITYMITSSDQSTGETHQSQSDHTPNEESLEALKVNKDAPLEELKAGLNGLSFQDHCEHHGIDPEQFFEETEIVPKNSWDTQVGGNHYKELGVEPLELTLKNLGYEAFVGACYCKVNKYLTRKKEGSIPVEELRKAQHVLNIWIEEAEKING